MEPRGIAPRSGLLISRTFITIVRRTGRFQYRLSFWLWEGEPAIHSPVALQPSQEIGKNVYSFSPFGQVAEVAIADTIEVIGQAGQAFAVSHSDPGPTPARKCLATGSLSVSRTFWLTLTAQM